MARSTLVVGVGQPVRHDDAAGLAAAHRLQARADLAARVITCEGDCTTLVEALRGIDLAIIIDAMCSGRTAGAIHRFDAHDRPLPATFSRASSHAFGVPEAVELTRALGQLPPVVIVFGIEGLDFEMGDGLSPAVDAAVDAVVTQVSDLLTTLA